MANQNDIRQSITNQIIEALEIGNVPPWRGRGVWARTQGHRQRRQQEIVQGTEPDPAGPCHARSTASRRSGAEHSTSGRAWAAE